MKRAAAQPAAVLRPLVHVTDLYHPPQDPDDHLDLLTALALPEYDLRAVILDATRRFLVAAPEGWDVRRDPGFVPVTQIAHLLGRPVRAAAGPVEPLRSVEDDATDRPAAEQAGVELLLEVLRTSAEPVTISVVGSGRVLAAAISREPELVRTRTRAVLLNAGSTGGPKREWNVGLDPAAYVALWRSRVAVDWFPCGTESGAFDPAHERGTFWKASHEELFAGLPEALRGWLGYAFSGSARGDIIGALAESGRGAVWEHVLAGERNLWSTASLVIGAGRVLARTEHGWRFVAEAEAAGGETWPWRLDPIDATVDGEARVAWRPAATEGGPWRLFGRLPGEDYGRAMAEALNALWRTLPL